VNALLASSQANLTASRFNDALQNVTDALTVAPNYGAARVQMLRIRRASTDRASFQKEAQVQIDRYREIANGSTNHSELSSVYLALLSYSSLDAVFKAQLAPLIQELKYKLGIEQRPPTPQQIAQANELVRRARALAQQGTEESYKQAVDLLTKVSAIIPLYDPARELSQEIAAQRVEATPDRLGAAAQGRYNQAWSLYLSGALDEANVIVEDLWKNPNNQPYVPLQQLRAFLMRDLHIPL
jgi:TolA-binding protein